MKPKPGSWQHDFVELLESLGRHEVPYLVVGGYAPTDSSTLVFACSVEHASIMTLVLNRAHGETVAALVTG